MARRHPKAPMGGKDWPLKMKRFVDAYAGNAKQAAIESGYSEINAANRGMELLGDPRVAEAIRKRTEKEMRPTIASRLELQEWWTSILRDEDGDMDARLKASQMLARSHGMFLDKVQVSGEHTLKLPEGVSVEALETIARGEPMPALPSGEPDEPVSH